MAQELKIQQRIGQRLTQQQLRFVRMLELNAPELDDAVQRELEANPALEVADADAETERRTEDTTPYYLRKARSSSPDTETPDFVAPSAGESLYEALDRQISERELTPEVAAMARYIVGNLDSNGYLLRPLPKLIDDLLVSTGREIPEAVAREAFELVRSLDPAGVGAENLRDTLLLQLRRLPDSPQRNDAIDILTHQFEAFHMRHSHKIISALKLSQTRIDAANALILTLNPKPGSGLGDTAADSAQAITPDFVVTNDNGELSVALNNRIPELVIDESFREAMKGLEGRRGRPRKGMEYVTSRFNEARDFLTVLRQRQRTMHDVMTAIVKWQKEYFETGDVYSMRTMMLKDLSNVTGYDPSVISRATANKYVQMPWGSVMPLRSFFSDTVGDENDGGAAGEALTNRKVEAIIREVTSKEDKRHPLSDEKIREILSERGYGISRRTVAKYRDRLGILVARLRKQL